jgi:hypothetical protein
LSQKDNINSRLTPHKYLNKYVFNDLHEVFFCDFSHVLQEWILRLKEKHPTNQIKKIEWNPMEITYSYNKLTINLCVQYISGQTTLLQDLSS